MMNINQWTGIGRLTSAPEVKSVGSSKVASFRLAVNRSYKKGDSWIEKPMFIDCEAWSHAAEKVESSLQTGTEVFVRGRLELDEWGGSDGKEKRSKHKIYVLELQIGKNRKGGDSGETSDNYGDESESISSRDLPF